MIKNFITIALLAIAINIQAINVKNRPHTVIQPDGTKIECFITGDEFGGMIHDANGYAFLRDKKDGWWKYAAKENEGPICSKYVVGKDNPSEKGLEKGVYSFNKEFYEDVSKRRKDMVHQVD